MDSGNSSLAVRQPIAYVSHGLWRDHITGAAAPHPLFGGVFEMKRLKLVLLAGMALAAAQPGWAQDATIVGVRIAIGDGPVIQNGHIVVQNGRIVAVGPGRPTQVLGTVIDGSGMTALPGLVDGHKHINSGRLEKEQMADLIENGFTTVLS
ncbi:MAG: hypothetical protein ABL964_08465, partial [Steroidobacteraceae bacterium]